jgi:rhamnulokinase
VPARAAGGYPEGVFHLAVDLGAGSGKAVLGRVDADGLTFARVHRFVYPPSVAAGHLRWDFSRILEGIKASLGAAQRAAQGFGGDVQTMAVDTWGVDYGLLDATGRLIEDPVCYRDDRTDGAVDVVTQTVPREEIFERTGIQLLPINTLFQLAAHARSGLPVGARRLVMMPDLCHHALCGSTTGEYTNASTTQLLDIRTGTWADDLFARLELPRDLMPEIRSPGADLGEISPALSAELGLGAVRVLACATHDTASAIAGTPLEPGWAYVSSGTWSLVGVERTTPLVNARAAEAPLPAAR